MKLQKYKDYYNKVSVFFNTNKANYWNSITKCNVHSKPAKLGSYYLDFSSKSEYIGTIDENGIPLYSLGSGEIFYHPIVICQYALGLHEMFLLREKNTANYKKKFLCQADWLIENIEEKDGKFGWLLKYNIDSYNLKAPWYSAMAQGEAISVLTRAHLLSGKENYIQIARKALDIFEYSIVEGGIVNIFKTYPIYEEYPSPIKPVAVLNGFIFSLYGLYDLHLASVDKRAEKLFKIGVNSLSNIIKFYDLKYWSQYHLFNYPKAYPASITYQLLAVEQLKTLYILTGKNIFLEYSNRWAKQSDSITSKLRALITKIFFAHTLSWSDVKKTQ